MYSTVEKMDAREYSKKLLQYLLLKELPKQWMTANSPVKIDIVTFQEWMNAILTVKKKKKRYTTSKVEWLQL